MNRLFEQLKKKIVSRKAHVALVGLGYVGLPIAVEFAKAGFSVTGIDVDPSKIDSLRRGKSYILDIPDRELAPLVRRGDLKATSDYRVLRKVDAVIICVPTPLNRIKEPDMTYIESVRDEVKKYLHPGMLVILESTTYTGTTEEVIRQPLEKSGGFRAGSNFFLCFSPERIDPANRHFKTADIPKVVGGTTAKCTDLGALLYGQVIRKVHRVSSTQVAEMTKLIENTFRIVNIALANELAKISKRLGVDIWEAIDAASTKPFGFMPFYPGPGIGGHCIGIDPIYLKWRARHHGGMDARFIALASETNEGMPEYVVDRTYEVLNQRKKSLRGSRILVIGVSYKKDVEDMRESPALEVIEKLIERGARVQYHDPYVPRLECQRLKLRSVPLSRSSVRNVDLVLITTNHSNIDYRFLLKEAKLIFDTRNALKGLGKCSKIVKL